LRAYGLLLLSAVLMCLGFAGFGIWPLAFVGMVPALFVFDAHPRPRGGRFLRRAFFFGYFAYYGGFYWVVDTIADFGGFPYGIALLFASALFIYQACQFVLVLWLFRRARERGANPTLSLVAAYLTGETVFPMLFPHFYGNSFHMLTPVVQIVDLGGPMLLTALAMAGNGLVYEVIRALLRRERCPRVAPVCFAGYACLVLVYGHFRIADVEARMAAAPQITVGVVQGNMGIREKREDPGEGLRRHLEQSLALEADPLDLLIWPESAVVFAIGRAPGTKVPVYFRNALRYYGIENPGVLGTPLLFGALSIEESESGEAASYNTAFITDDEGRVVDHYDKTYLLPFGEYLPFAETFPFLEAWSPNSGDFTAGEHVQPLRFRDFRISALVCYEDILPGFTRRAVREGDPHLLVNVTNDSWFGRTQEPYVHLYLAAYRAVEHRRYLVRATNTGVSAIIDPLGRRVEEGPLFGRADLRAEIALLHGATIYGRFGDWPGWLALVTVLYLGFVGRRRPQG